MKVKMLEEKVEKLSEHTEKILKHAGKLMQCLEDLSDEDYGERDDDDDDDDEYMERGYRHNYGRGGMRRRRDSRGRYM